METTELSIAETLQAVEGANERARAVIARHSVDNGTVLLTLGMTFLLDMLCFELSRLVGSVWPAVIAIMALNSVVVMVWFRYAWRLPVRPLRAHTQRVILTSHLLVVVVLRGVDRPGGRWMGHCCWRVSAGLVSAPGCVGRGSLVDKRCSTTAARVSLGASRSHATRSGGLGIW